MESLILYICKFMLIFFEWVAQHNLFYKFIINTMQDHLVGSVLSEKDSQSVYSGNP